ncbi:MAG TPA: ferredoxin [Ilumatobacter sp.]|nr:ferredoxin [Ilumatobacter sp.]
MNVEIDLTRCEANGLCIALAPELFQLDASGDFALVRQEALVDATLASARQAAASCPRQAISVNSD